MISRDRFGKIAGADLVKSDWFILNTTLATIEFKRDKSRLLNHWENLKRDPSAPVSG